MFFFFAQRIFALIEFLNLLIFQPMESDLCETPGKKIQKSITTTVVSDCPRRQSSSIIQFVILLENHWRKLNLSYGNCDEDAELLGLGMSRPVLHSVYSQLVIEDLRGKFIEFTCLVDILSDGNLLHRTKLWLSTLDTFSLAISRENDENPLSGRWERVGKRVPWRKGKNRFSQRSQFVVIISWQCCVSIAVPQKFFTLWECRGGKKEA